MDLVQDYVRIAQKFLPPSLLNTLITMATTAFGIAKTLQTHLTPLILRVTTQPDLATILTLAVVLLISFKILDMAYRAVMFWINLVFRLVMWGSVATIGLWIWHRGVDGFIDDVQGLVEFWKDRYDEYSGEVSKFQKQQEVRMGGGAKYDPYGMPKGGRAKRGWR
ncbi:nuclear pore assembly and biogenesis-domain-containing protein [Clohesyomyces aquaticus]|uniref:Nuclear pore assembly and biogenesis-domain-containing protein n=1 Tax=Clohesyomyces aquaticus TaxID=1231657 RepID=A0A1Y1Y5C3_9PLEO|nr:nuclear pore assembly and biogenesis-domain-containing protein [Clohesyomyces aquaticus]